jgi:hypothetical protein
MGKVLVLGLLQVLRIISLVVVRRRETRKS